MADARVAAVDIAAARPSTLVLLDGLHAVEWFEATSVGAATDWLLARRPDVIAIDAPCSVSRGLLANGRDGAKPYAGRVSDLELMSRGISLYQVPQKRADVQPWMEIGYRLYDALRDAGYILPQALSVQGSAIEIYPYAGFAALLGRIPLKKTTAEGLAQRVEVLRDQGLEWDGRSDHDSLDALVGALTGLRYLQGQATAVGDSSEALIWLPATEMKQSYYAPPMLRTPTSPSTPTGSPTSRPPCACGCGGFPKGRHSRFLPGHDAKLLSQQLREQRAEASIDLHELNAMYSGLSPAEREESALGAAWTRSVHGVASPRDSPPAPGKMFSSITLLRHDLSHTPRFECVSLPSATQSQAA